MDYQAVAGELLNHRTLPEDLTEDQQVLLINEAAQQASDRTQQGEDMDDEVENLVIWLGGLRQDIRLYGFQLIHVFHNINYTASDEVIQRLESVRDPLNRITTGYMASRVEDLDRHHWPRDFLDGSTFQDRLMALDMDDQETDLGLQDQLSRLPTPDEIITGVAGEFHGELDMSLQYATMVALVYDLRDKYVVLGGKANTVTDGQLIRVFDWAARHMNVELNVLLTKSILAIYRIGWKDDQVLSHIDPTVRSIVESDLD